MYRYVSGYRPLTPLKNFAAFYINEHEISRDQANPTFIPVSYDPAIYMYAYVNDTYETKISTIGELISRQGKLMILNSGDAFEEPDISEELADKILDAKLENKYDADIAESTVFMDIKNALDDLFNIVNYRALADQKKY